MWVGLADEKGTPHEGQMVFLDNALDAQTGTIRARALLDNKERRFTPGLFARVKLEGSAKYDAVLVNDSAIGTDQNVRYVFAVGPDNKVEYRAVKLGPVIDDGLRVVRDGLKPGELDGRERPAARAPGRDDRPAEDCDGREDGVGRRRARFQHRLTPEAGRQGGGIPPPASPALTTPPQPKSRDATVKLSHFFIERPVFAAVLSAVHHDRRRHRAVPAAGGGISRGRSAFRRGARESIRARTRRSSPKPWPRRWSRPSSASKTCCTCLPPAAMDGTLTLTVTFKIGADVDRAQVQVQNRVSQALPRLPQEVRDLGVNTAKSSPNLMGVVHLISPDGRYDALYLRNYAVLNVQRRARAPAGHGRSAHLRRRRLLDAYLARPAEAGRSQPDDG